MDVTELVSKWGNGSLFGNRSITNVNPIGSRLELDVIYLKCLPYCPNRFPQIGKYYKKK